MINLDISSCITGVQRDPPTYDLFAKIDHSGTNYNGHYTAGCKNRKDQEWYSFDDEKTQKLNWEDIVTREAYVLFYHKNSIEQFFTQSSKMPELWPHVLSKDITENNTENDEQKSLSYQIQSGAQSTFTTLVNFNPQTYPC